MLQWHCPPLAPLSSAELGDEGARAAETGRLAPQASCDGGEDRENNRLSDVQTSHSTNSPRTQQELFAHFDRPLFSLQHGDSISNYGDFAPSITTTQDEDGAGSMLVGSSRKLQHHVSARHAIRDGQNSPPAASPPPVVNMEAATADAIAQDAPAVAIPDPALTTPDAPAVTLPDPSVEQNLNVLDTSLPSLGDPIQMPVVTDMYGAGMATDFTAMDFSQPMISDERLTAFARLRFDDGSYYMHTYQIILGRNIELAHRDMRRLAKVDQLHAEGQPQAAEDLLNGKASKKKKRRAARSVISEKGGIVSAPIASMPMEYQQRRQSNASHSLSSASHPTADSSEEKAAERAPQDMIMQAFPEVPAQFDGHVPEDPHDCPLVPIHPQHITARTGSHGPKGISREHAKIFYDFDQGHFCIEVLGSNGLHHENVFRYRGEVVPLDHGDCLVIGAVNIQFYLPDVALTEDQRHRQESGSRPMSFSFENGHGELESDEQESSDSEGELSVNPKHVYHYPVSEAESDDVFGDDDDLDDYEEPVPRQKQKQSVKIKLKVPPPPAVPKETKKAHKRKHREITPDDIPIKKLKSKHKESNREPAKEVKAAKEPKESKEPKEAKEKGKAPAKTSTKTPVKEETPVEAIPKEVSVEKKPEPKPVNDSPPLLRKPFEGELEAGGEIEGLITEEMARHHNLPATLIGQVVEKRKGPGRPPKDGIMSKRQRSQLIKQAKEIERAKAAGIDPADIPMPSMKPKIVKRKDSNAIDGEDGDVMESTENGDGLERRQSKPSKPPRTPSPEPRMEDYTEEQLQRPTANYVVLIHEAISSSPTGQMNLQQIYNYIERKYPWYKFKTTTSGWQSSVRHNLGQHDAFVKGDKEGKGFNWKVNQDVSIEKERRKRQQAPRQSPYSQQSHAPPQGSHSAGVPGRYLSTTHPDLIRQLEAFRKVYLDARTEPGEDQKVDNAIRAYVDPQFPKEKLTSAEGALLHAIASIKELAKYSTNGPVAQPAAPVNVPVTSSTDTAGTVAAIAADAAAGTVTQPTPSQQVPAPSGPPLTPAPQTPSEPQKFTPNMMGAAPTASVTASHVASLPPSHRPSVEPLTPVPGSPAIQNGTLQKRSIPDISQLATDTTADPAETAKIEGSGANEQHVEQKKEQEDEASPQSAFAKVETAPPPAG
ncbi:hypothetical protein EK21DRAFT_65915 [Setomelanomma holmii]|uniref:Uncharacterized protein n=1 Tax=Setomelanomma holmii TaxID=210430 RepID=A0A9P4HB69_9PLEO|nr:hypothetical protein EK21DRAFT_65915 [Setomelanomma holmii]